MYRLNSVFPTRVAIGSSLALAGPPCHSEAQPKNLAVSNRLIAEQLAELILAGGLGIA